MELSQQSLIFNPWGQIRWNFVVLVSYYQILNVITEFMLLQYKQQGYEVTFISTHRFNKTMNHQKKEVWQ